MDWLFEGELKPGHAVAFVVAVAATALAVSVHYEGVKRLAQRYAIGPGPHVRTHGTMLAIMFALLGLHMVEILIFGFATWGLLRVPGAGGVVGEGGAHDLVDAVYLSASTYTTLGFGDLMPTGALRMLSGCEAVTGLLLIAWSASFTYLEMSRLWGGHAKD